jgi:hypothetical protein
MKNCLYKNYDLDKAYDHELFVFSGIIFLNIQYAIIKGHKKINFMIKPNVILDYFF